MAQVQVTVAPVATLTFAGEKKLLPTVTPLPPPPVGPVGIRPAAAAAGQGHDARARSTDFLRIASSTAVTSFHPSVHE